MKRKHLFLWLFTLVAFNAAGQENNARLLVFSKTEGFRHQSIPAGIEALKKMGQEQGFSITATEDAGYFTDQKLGEFDAVVFLNTTGDILDDAQQAAFEKYIRAGRGFVGIHSATDTEYDWPWYGQLVGAYFKSHPPTTKGRLKVVSHDHPSTEGLPGEFSRRDEWYNFKRNPSPDTVNILVTIDETSYGDGKNKSHPVTWYHEFDGGRAFYTIMGHTPESFSEPIVLKHILGGIRYALGTP